MRTAYLVVSNLWVEEVEVLHEDSEFCVIRYPGSDGRFQVRKNRLSRTREKAENRLPKREAEKPIGRMNHVKGPWEYPH